MTLVSLGFLAFPAFLAAAPAGERARCSAPYDVGYRIVTLPNGPQAAVWYPTSGAQRPFNYTGEIRGRAAQNGEPSRCGTFPLVVFSHGLAGCGTQSIFLTEQLARRGYVVIAPDHKDASCHVDGSGQLAIRASAQSFLRPQDWTPETYADRRLDLEKAIDWATTAGDLRGIVDKSKIGAAGHSIGGYTVLGMAGAWPSWKDRRIRALLLLSPYVQPFLLQNRLRSVTLPQMYQGAGFDLGITPSLRGKKGAFGVSAGPVLYVELKGGSHFEWTNAVCLGQKDINTCFASRPNARLIATYAAVFFDRYLKGASGELEKLRGAGLSTFEKR